MSKPTTPAPHHREILIRLELLRAPSAVLEIGFNTPDIKRLRDLFFLLTAEGFIAHSDFDEIQRMLNSAPAARHRG